MKNSKRDKIVLVVITFILLLFYGVVYSFIVSPLVEVYNRVDNIEFKSWGNFLDIYAAKYLNKPIYSSEFELFNDEKLKTFSIIDSQNNIGAFLKTEDCVITVNSYEVMPCIDTGDSFISSLFPSNNNGGILRLNISVQNNTDSVLSVRSKHFKVIVDDKKYKVVSDYVGAVMLVEDLYENGIEPNSVGIGNLYIDIKDRVFDSIELLYEVKDISASVFIDTHNYSIDEFAIETMCSMVISDMLR